MNKYVITINSSYIRDAQVFNNPDMTDENLEQAMDYISLLDEWSDIDRDIYLCCIDAKDEIEAKKIVSKTYMYDIRILNAMPV